MSGGMWINPYVGFFDRRAPDGEVWAGCRNIDEVVDRLTDIDAKMRADGLAEDALLYAWGVDPLYFDGERMYASHLDRVSETRPIFVHHASGHLATANSAMMRKENITADTQTPGVARGPDGRPNGELQEPPAMQLATEAFRGDDGPHQASRGHLELRLRGPQRGPYDRHRSRQRPPRPGVR